MTAQMFEVDEHVVESRVTVRIILRDHQQQIIRNDLNRLLDVAERKPGVTDDVLLVRKANLLRRLVGHPGSRVAQAHRAGGEGPSVCQRLSLPYLRTGVPRRG